MPDSSNPQAQIWITLPQALRWAVTGEAPTRENRKILPPCFPAHTSRAELFNFWIEGHLRLYGLDGVDSRRPWTPLKSTLTYEDDCWEGTDFIRIRPQLIKQANFDSIDWKNGTLGRFFLLDHEDASLPYFVDLRVRWNDLLKFFPKKEASEIKQAEGSGSSAHSQPEDFVTDKKTGPGRPKRPDWPLMAALAAIIWEREPKKGKSDAGMCDRVGKILLATNYKCPSADFEDAPSLDGFIRYAIVPVECARRLFTIEEIHRFKQRKRHRDRNPELLYLVSALASLISERKHAEWINFSDSKKRAIVAQIIESAEAVDSDGHTISADSKIIGLALSAVNEAKEHYEQERQRSLARRK